MASGAGIGFDGVLKGSSGVTATATVAFLAATFLTAVFLAATFFATVLVAVFFTACLVAAFFAARLVVGGVSWSVSLLIRNRLESWGA